jgi:hypothetical protein
MSSFSSVVQQRIRASSLDEKRKQEALGKLAHANDDEIAVLFGVMNIRASWVLRGRHDPIAELLKGAHLLIWDSGARYDDWRRLPSAKSRISSHRSDGTQYHVDGPLVHTVLFGRLGDRTWLQLENHPVGVGHGVDYVKYKISNENQGPYGSSPYLDKRPIEVHPRTYWRELGDFPTTGLDRSIG